MSKEFSESDWDVAIDTFDAHEDRNSPLWMQQANPEARGEREAFHLSHPWSAFRERLTQKADRSRLGRRLSLNLWVSGLGLAASCAVVLMLVAPQATEKGLNHSVESGIREKGAVSGLNPTIQVSPPVLRVLRGEQALSNGALLKPGDQIKFSVDTMDYDHLFIFGIEENGPLTAYYPEAGRSLIIGQSNGLTLPDFVELNQQ
ncbi:MAG TPA: hypothetical protein EYN66_23160, partial [Myxococcales bacterium]|nr:hypothetical protein [Myxococcales bacterium]